MTAVSRLLSRDLALSGAPVPFRLRRWRGGTRQRLPREANGQVTVKQCSGTPAPASLWSAAGRRAPARCAREGALPGGRAVMARAAARQAPRRRGSLPGRARRPRAGRLAAGARPFGRAAGPPAAGAQGRRPAARGPGTVSGNGRPFIRVREPVTLPHRQLIRPPVGVPPRQVPPGGDECAGRGKIKPSSGLPDSYKRKALKTIIRGGPQMRGVR